MIPLKFEFVPITVLVHDPVKAANLNRSIQEYFGEVKTEYKNLVQQLMPQDKNIRPSWCKSPIHPPRANKAGKMSRSSDQACPKLPATRFPAEQRGSKTEEARQ
jgi:hypothetical protein